MGQAHRRLANDVGKFLRNCKALKVNMDSMIKTYDSIQNFKSVLAVKTK